MKLSQIYENWLDLYESDIKSELCRYNYESGECQWRIKSCGDGWNEPRESYCISEDNCPFIEAKLEDRFQSDIDDGYLEDYLQDGIENDMEETFNI